MLFTAALTCRTIARGVKVGPEGMRMGCFIPVTSSFTCVPPTSMTRMRRFLFISSFPLSLGARRARDHHLAQRRDDCHHGGMQTVFEAAGGNDGLRRLADAWHRRVMADDVVGHAFSHGFHPQHVERLAAYWAEGT